MVFITIYVCVLVILLPMSYRYLRDSKFHSFMAGPDAAFEETPVYLCLEINPGPSAHNVTLWTELFWFV
jgi:hypothetical protein